MASLTNGDVDMSQMGAGNLDHKQRPIVAPLKANNGHSRTRLPDVENRSMRLDKLDSEARKGVALKVDKALRMVALSARLAADLSGRMRAEEEREAERASSSPVERQAGDAGGRSAGSASALAERLRLGRLAKKTDWNALFVKLAKVFLQYFLDLILNDIFGTTGEFG